MHVDPEAIRKRAIELVTKEPDDAITLIGLAKGQKERITAYEVLQAASTSDPFASKIVDKVAQALITEGVNILNDALL